MKKSLCSALILIAGQILHFPVDAEAQTGVTYTGGVTYLEFSGEAGDWVSGGRSYRYTSEKSKFSVGFNYTSPLEGIRISVNETDVQNNLVSWWNVEFAPVKGSGKLLNVGTYPTAQRYPFNEQGKAGFNISGDGRGCNILEASFTILELELDPMSGNVVRFAADFEQHCEQRADWKTPALRGKVRYNSLLVESCSNLTDDADNDGVPTVADLCPGSAANLAVDRAGCTQAQFCAEIVNAHACNNSDFKNDLRVGRAPRDCSWSSIRRRCVQSGNRATWE